MSPSLHVWFKMCPFFSAPLRKTPRRGSPRFARAVAPLPEVRLSLGAVAVCVWRSSGRVLAFRAPPSARGLRVVGPCPPPCFRPPPSVLTNGGFVVSARPSRLVGSADISTRRLECQGLRKAVQRPPPRALLRPLTLSRLSAY